MHPQLTVVQLWRPGQNHPAHAEAEAELWCGLYLFIIHTKATTSEYTGSAKKKVTCKTTIKANKFFVFSGSGGGGRGSRGGCQPVASPWNAWLGEFIGPLWTNRNEVIILLTRVARNLHGWMDDQIEFLAWRDVQRNHCMNFSCCATNSAENFI